MYRRRAETIAGLDLCGRKGDTVPPVTPVASTDETAVYKPARVVLALACLLAILAYLGNQAFLSPDVQFLAPAMRGVWIVHPNLPLPGYPEAVFVRRFTLPAVTDSYPVRITAMRESDVTVNGERLPPVVGPNWKRAAAYDLGPALHPGPNEVRIHVTNRASPPALLVEGPQEICSDERWTAVLSPDDDREASAAVAFRDEKFLEFQPNVWRASPRFWVWASAFAAYCLLVLYAALPCRAPAQATATPTTEPSGAADPQDRLWLRYGWVGCLLLFAIVAMIQFRNARVYPPTRGFDPVQHADYVRLVGEHWQVPDVHQGWEMSQPPLYYALSACLYRLCGGPSREDVALKAVQMLSPVAMLATVALTWWLLGLVLPTQGRARVLGFVVVAVLPVGFYMSPQVTNEVFSALAIGIAMLLASRQIVRREARWRDALLLGAACGLALLSKYTGLFVFLSILSLVGLRMLTGAARPTDSGMAGLSIGRRRLRQLAWAAIFVGVTFTLCGWLYVRNVTKFGNPFVGAWDRGSGFNIVQGPGYRTLGFYTRFGSVFWQTLGRSRDASFWDGMYGAMWADTHGMFLNANDPRAAALSSLCLWLALLPTVAILIGFLRAVRHLLTRHWDHPYFVLVVVTVLTVTAVLSFALQHPFYSNLKAHFALSLTPCAGVFAALGLETMCQRLGRLRWLLYLNLVLLGALVLSVFWYR